MTEDMTLVAYCQSEATQEESTRCLLAAFAYLGIPKSLIDLGCGPGHLVRLASGAGSRYCVGVDLHADLSFGPETDEEGGWCVFRGDLMDPELDPLDTVPFFMVLCWEVAEHLPPEAADTLCDTTVSVLAPGGVLLWSAARPGQGGAGHLNEQLFHSYWLPKLEARGLRYDDEATGSLAALFAWVAPKAPWYGANIRVLRKS